MPPNEGLQKIGFKPAGSASILDFTRHDKQVLTYVRLHSAAEPGCFGFLREGRRVHRGAVPTSAAFWELLFRHGWQPACEPIHEQYQAHFREAT